MFRKITGATLFTILLLTTFTTHAQDADPIRAKVNAAKKTFDTELEKQKQAVLLHFERREQLARKEGNKRQLDQISAERLAFESKGELRDSVLKATSYRSHVATARKTYISALNEAIKAYIRDKKDIEASVIEKELEEFRGLNLDTKDSDDRILWLAKSGKGYKLIGDKSWIEVANNGKRKFTEVERTEDFVELRADDDNGIYVRLHNSVYYWGTIDRTQKVRVWSQWLSPEDGSGGWIKK